MRALIRPDGTKHEFADPLPMRKIEDLLGAMVLDSVNLRHTEPLHVMLCDDQGHARKRPVNPEATGLFLLNCKPGTLHQIRGPVFVCPDEDFAEPSKPL